MLHSVWQIFFRYVYSKAVIYSSIFSLCFLSGTLFWMLLLKFPLLRGFDVGSNTPAKSVLSSPTPVRGWDAQGKDEDWETVIYPWIWVGMICRKWMHVFIPHLDKDFTTIICMIVMSRLIFTKIFYCWEAEGSKWAVLFYKGWFCNLWLYPHFKVKALYAHLRDPSVVYDILP